MRAFVGLPLPPPESVVQLLDDLRSCGADYKVVEPKNFHLTVKFLGEIPEAQAAIILERLRAATLPRDYRVVLRDVGAFPDWKRLNILWIGLQDPEGALAKTIADAERSFAEIGFPRETRPFSPHATIARKRSERDRDAAKNVLSKHRNEEFGEIRVHAPVLFRSTLTPQGPVYEPLGEAVA